MPSRLLRHYAARNIRSSLPRPSLDPLYVIGDQARLVQILANVMGNAAKYTEPGGQIGIRVSASDDAVKVKISDTGAGIAPEFMPRLFDMFAQANQTLDRSQGGLGIGLPVVKKLVEMHGGQVTAHSKGLGHGSTFEITFPRAPPPPAISESPAEDRAPARRILIVDDNVDAASSLGTLLEMDGHQIQTANCSSDALKFAETFEPDVVLLDIGLPDMDGYEVTRRMRQLPRGSGLTIVALTGYSQDEDRKRSHDAGCDGHLVKPLDFATLEKLLARSGPVNNP